MKTLLSLVALSLALPAFADDTATPAAPAPAASPLSFNVGVFSDYRYRGISQTRLKPAVQGGVDYAAPGGFYVGAWASSIKWIRDAGGDANAEVDLYGGYKAEVSPGLTLDVGVLQYLYPSNKLNPSANTFEVYGAATFGPVTAKYSHSATNLFGFADSKNSGYLDVSANFDVGGGITLTPHVGHQTVRRNAGASYTDYALTASKDFAGWVASAGVVGTDAKGYTSPNGRDLGKTSLVVGLKTTF